MKHNLFSSVRKITTSFLIVTGTVSTMTFTALTARAGFDNGNAGDSYSAEFINSGRDVLQRLEILALAGRGVYETTRLRQAMESTKVGSIDHVIMNDGRETDAVNQPDKGLITISRTRWEKLRQKSETKGRLQLALHEYLWMTGVNDEYYKVSAPIIEVLNVPDYSPSVWQNVPGTKFAVVECTGRTKGLSYVTVIIHTKGATNAPDTGEVKIERRGNSFGYRFPATEISQFFESDAKELNTAMVGFKAFVNSEFPVSIQYSGTNFVDMDLKAIIESGEADKMKGNSMSVWKGPGFAADQQYVLESPVCSVYSNN